MVLTWVGRSIFMCCWRTRFDVCSQKWTEEHISSVVGYRRTHGRMYALCIRMLCAPPSQNMYVRIFCNSLGIRWCERVELASNNREDMHYLCTENKDVSCNHGCLSFLPPKLCVTCDLQQVVRAIEDLLDPFGKPMTRPRYGVHRHIIAHEPKSQSYVVSGLRSGDHVPLWWHSFPRIHTFVLFVLVRRIMGINYDRCVVDHGSRTRNDQDPFCWHHRHDGSRVCDRTVGKQTNSTMSSDRNTLQCIRVRGEIDKCSGTS